MRKKTTEMSKTVKRSSILSDNRLTSVIMNGKNAALLTIDTFYGSVVTKLVEVTFVGALKWNQSSRH